MKHVKKTFISFYKASSNQMESVGQSICYKSDNNVQEKVKLSGASHAHVLEDGNNIENCKYSI